MTIIEVLIACVAALTILLLTSIGLGIYIIKQRKQMIAKPVETKIIRLSEYWTQKADDC